SVRPLLDRLPRRQYATPFHPPSREPFMKLRLFAAAALAAALAAGCGPAVNYKYRIAVIPKGLTHQFWQSIHRGADRAAADLGKQGIAVEGHWTGPAKERD